MQGDPYQFSCITVDSIRLMADIANLAPISVEVAKTLGEDATFRLKQVITRARRFMQHSNRVQLTCADINKALRWSDSQPVFGHASNPNQAPRFSFRPDAMVFAYDDECLDLDEKNKSSIGSHLSQSQLNEAVPELSMNKLIQ